MRLSNAYRDFEVFKKNSRALICLRALLSAMAYAPGDLWLISAPGEKTNQETWDKLNRTTSSLSSNYKFNIPDLKVTLINFIPSKRAVVKQ
ncbi:unnamed protein product [Anisakis simplex]|uniref:V-type proton ATPase subunit C n=1 Tax=Anisakis simplex TaxID=6269 RepID=A0A0M3JMK3_ANISI|nr:unnamed protein product [Anisakis simplex]